MSRLITEPKVRSLQEIIGEFGREFRVPIYQRDYAWGEDQIDDFVSDLFGIQPEREHFFGTVVLSDTAPGVASATSAVKYVIDGQQRLITSLLTIVAIRHLLLEIGAAASVPVASAATNHAMGLRQLTAVGIGQHPPPRLWANRLNQQFLTPLLTGQHELVGEVASRESVMRLFDSLSDDVAARSLGMCLAYERVAQQLARRVLTDSAPGIDPDSSTMALVQSEGDQDRCLQHLIALGGSLLEQSMFVEITVPRWEDAFAVFEGLNNRGLELSERDLVKNAVLAKAAMPGAADPVELQTYETRWDRLTGRIADSKFVRFLRHYLLLSYQDVPLKRVVRTLNDHFAGRTADQMLQELENASQQYEKITRPGGTVNNRELKEAIRALNVLDAERAYPILLAGFLVGLRNPEMVQLIRSVEVLYFRRSAIMGKDNKVIEVDFQRIASRLYRERREALDWAIQSLLDLTPGDVEFIASFEHREAVKDATARYMLVQMENHLSGGRTREVVFDNVTLEHILPRDPSQWDLTLEESQTHQALFQKLGNLTLLKGAANSSNGNRPFADKKHKFVEDDLRINARVVGADRWWAEEITQRQRELAEIACMVWSPNRDDVTTR